jgi:hypothetical protein
VQWLDRLLFAAALLGGLISLLNTACFVVHARNARSRARRLAALTLSALSAGLVLEAALFLAFDSGAASASAARMLATAIVRLCLLSASSALAALVLRARPPLRR